MANSLFNLVKPFSNDNLLKSLYEDFKNFDQEFGLADFRNETTWKDTGKAYKLEVSLGNDFNLGNVEITLDEEKFVKVNYEEHSGNAMHKFSLTETLPEDALAETLSAEKKDGKIVLTVNHKVDGEEVDKKHRTIKVTY